MQVCCLTKRINNVAQQGSTIMTKGQCSVLCLHAAASFNMVTQIHTRLLLTLRLANCILLLLRLKKKSYYRLSAKQRNFILPWGNWYNYVFFITKLLHTCREKPVVANAWTCENNKASNYKPIIPGRPLLGNVLFIWFRYQSVLSIRGKDYWKVIHFWDKQ